MMIMNEEWECYGSFTENLHILVVIYFMFIKVN